MLCERCQDLFRGEVTVKRRGQLDFHEKEVIFESSLEQLSDVGNCFLCHRIYQYLLWKPDELWENPTQPLFITLGLRKTVTVAHFGTLRVSIHYKDRKKGLDLLDLGLSEIQGVRIEQLKPYFDSFEAGSSTNSTWTLRLASAWLQDCISNHPKCKTQEGRKLPTRLLELNSSTPNHLRLRETASFQHKPTYMTLSHCWGTVKLLTLTSETVETLSSGFPSSLLPPTFQDAVDVALKLGISFLWIDSLCIFQDSLQDWQREAPLMCDVYRGSTCNIGASASTNSLEGLFRARDPRLVQPCIVDTSFTNCPNYRGLIECEHHIGSIPHANNQPLFNRGWVLQERLLSPRMLHFGSEYIFWECESHSASEIYPRGLEIFQDGWPLKDTTETPSTPNQEYKRARAVWLIAIRLYLRCALTKPSDKLVAISGVARHLSSLGGPTDYLAGLWRRELPYNLLWGQVLETANVDDFATKPAQYRGPSWSWVSLDSLINVNLALDASNPEGSPCDWDYQQWPSRASNTIPMITVMDVRISHLTEDPYGEVTAAYLRVKGPLLRVTFTIIPGQTRCKDMIFGSSLGQRYPIKDVVVSWVHFDTWEIRRLCFTYPQELYFLPIAAGFADLDQKVLENAAGLLLCTTGVAKGQYERLGTIALRGVDKDPQWVRDLKPDASMGHTFGSGNDKEGGDLFECESFDGVEYIISIV
ncbi:hypothetical protein EG329_002274 [Mollisiaceae sp. DMI_Dod_QoI]|nr:hypothetical protein EG329_002274 [Helotiales sp. DMI_Dod_QoI]